MQPNFSGAVKLHQLSKIDFHNPLDRAMKWARTTVVAIALAGMAAGCREAKEAATPTSADIQLAAGDLRGTANLSGGDRTAFSKKCVARRAELHTSFTAGR